MSESLITKKAIAQGLKDLTMEKAFDKISIRDITQQCGLNRQTFYYHFQDKYELLNWIYFQEAFSPLMEGITFENWPLKLEELLKKMKQEQHFYRNTIKSEENCFQEYLQNITQELFRSAIEELDGNQVLEEEEKQFFAEFFSYGICAMVVNWARGGMKQSPEAVAKHLKYLVESSEKLAYTRYTEEHSQGSVKEKV